MAVVSVTKYTSALSTNCKAPCTWYTMHHTASPAVSLAGANQEDVTEYYPAKAQTPRLVQLPSTAPAIYGCPAKVGPA